jgi:hypothetical protein
MLPAEEGQGLSGTVGQPALHRSACQSGIPNGPPLLRAGDVSEGGNLFPKGGRGGIRTHETLARLPVFKTGAFNRSATRPAVLLV